MIYMLRTSRMQGDWAQAIQWANKIAQYINEKFPEVHVQVLLNVNGPRDQIHWSARYASLAAFEEKGAKIESDLGYQALVEEAGEMLVPGALEDNFYRTVD